MNLAGVSGAASIPFTNRWRFVDVHRTSTCATTGTNATMSPLFFAFLFHGTGVPKLLDLSKKKGSTRTDLQEQKRKLALLSRKGDTDTDTDTDTETLTLTVTLLTTRELSVLVVLALVVVPVLFLPGVGGMLGAT